jgi:hypothetical protein
VCYYHIGDLYLKIKGWGEANKKKEQERGGERGIF